MAIQQQRESFDEICNAFSTFLNYDKYYTPDELETVLGLVRRYFRFSVTNKKLKYFNVPFSFDIETSSFYDDNGEKTGIMYCWTFGIFGLVIFGRTWEEYITLITKLSKILDLNENKRIIIFVQNLEYEFQYFRLYQMWDKVFSVDTRKPLYAVNELYIEYRCSYLLSGYKLEKMGENLTKYNVKKLVGNLNYKLVRHCNTPMTQNEISYCVNDVKVVMAFVMESIIKNDGQISKIPLTKTGYVRNFVRNKCFYIEGEPHKKSEKRRTYQYFIKGLTLDVDSYEQDKRAFAGGFVHTSALKSGITQYDVDSLDLTSAYPSQIDQYYPMSPPTLINIESKEQFKEMLENYCCIFDIKFIGLEERFIYEHYISRSHCWGVINAIEDNGRIVSADELNISITNVDFDIIENFYKWEKFQVSNFRIYKKGYLPRDVVLSILSLYNDKTQLKNVIGKEVEYLNSKENINSVYGSMVTDPCRDLITYVNNVWGLDAKKLEESIAKYNTSNTRYLYYPWGIFITAYTRQIITNGILEFNEDYIYSDTDSLKVINADKHKKWVEDFNKNKIEYLEKMLDFYNIDKSTIRPKTIKGVEKPLGVFDFDGNYKRFKGLGAKRYLVEYSDDPRNDKKKWGKIEITVSGLNKSVCVPYLLKKYGKNGIFEHFNSKLKVPPEYTGKLTHTYIDECRTGIITDYLGNVYHYNELSSIHLESAGYEMHMEKYLKYLNNIKEIE